MVDYAAIYDQMDTNGDQQLTIQELKTALINAGGSDKDVACGFCACDKNGDSTLTKDEFVSEMSKKDRRVCFNDKFEELDADGSGKLSKDELAEMCRSQGLSDDDIDVLVLSATQTAMAKLTKWNFLPQCE